MALRRSVGFSAIRAISTSPFIAKAFASPIPSCVPIPPSSLMANAPARSNPFMMLRCFLLLLVTLYQFAQSLLNILTILANYLTV